MNNYKISSISLCFMSFCLISSTLLGIVFPYIINSSNYILTLILSFIMSIILIIIFLKIFNYLPNKNIFNKIDYTFNKAISVILKYMLISLMLLTSSYLLFRFISFVSNEYLTETRSFIITLLISLPILLSINKKIDVFARMSSSIIYASIFMFIISRLSLISKIQVDNLSLSFFSINTNIIINSIIVSFINIIPLYTLLLIPKDNVIDKENISKYIIYSYISSYIMIVFITITILGIFGINVSKIYTYPSYMVLKNISILNFIKNVQNFSILFWIMFMTFTTSFNLHYIKEAIKPKNKYITIVLYILFISITLLFTSKENLINKYNFLYVYIPFFLYLLIFIINTLLIIFKKK